MGVDHREAVLTVGPPMNFVTFVADLPSYLLKEIDVPIDMPSALKGLKLVLISVPELEGTRAAWQPVVVGHELAHYLQGQKPITPPVLVGDLLDLSALGQTQDELPEGAPLRSPRSRVLGQVANRWLNEIICDAFSVHRYGAAGVAALSEFLDAVGSMSFAGGTHPPGALRVALMLEWLGDSLTDEEAAIIGPFKDLATGTLKEDWAKYLGSAFLAAAGKIWTAVCQWTGSDGYSKDARSDAVAAISGLLEIGIPGSQEVHIEGADVPALPADVINAVWLAISRESDKPVNRLAIKALDNLDFLRRWTAAGGGSATLKDASPSTRAGTLTEREIQRRLLATDDSQLVVTPLMPGAVKGASMDLRLGNKFVIFERSSAAAFDALNPEQDPRSMQKAVEKAWGDVFYLHPGELVLAATLEYMVLPGDLSAQVITRSSYGRLGLLSATAVQVHPFFAGCLTLELVNLGVMPMAITPGERVAQLVLFTTTGEVQRSDKDKYRYPTGPEFSKITKDDESEVLGKMRKSYTERET